MSMIFKRCRLLFIDVFRSFKLEFVILLEDAFVLVYSIEIAREADAVSIVREDEELCGALLGLSFRREDIGPMKELVWARRCICIILQ